MLGMFWNTWFRVILIFILMSIIGSLILTGELYAFHFTLVFLLLVFVFSFYFFEKNKNTTYRKFIIKLFVYSFIIRTLFVYIFIQILNYYVGIPFLSEKDDFVYYLSGKEIADTWTTRGVHIVDDVRFSKGFYSGYPNFSAFLIYIFNGDPVVLPRLANGFFSALNVIVFYKIVRLFAKDEYARLVATILMFSPILITYSSLQLKDTILLYLTTMVVYNLSKIIINKVSIVNVLNIIIFSSVMLVFRPASLVPIFGAFFLLLIFNSTKYRKINLSFGNFAFGIISFIGLYYVWDLLHLYELIDSMEHYYMSRNTSILERSFQESSAGVTQTNIGKLLGAPLFIIASFFLPPVLIVDLPDSETINYTFIGMITHFSLLPFLIISIFKTFKYRSNYKIPIFLVLIILIFKIGQANSALSIFDPRQSLATLSYMYLLLPMFFVDKFSKSIFNFTIVISIVVIFSYAIVRLMVRGLI